jgi:Ca-activated chloride channel family protein
MDADLGGTEVLPALEFVLLKEPRAGFVRQVLLLTDGQVTNTDEVIGLVRRHSVHTRVFTFGIGAGASQHLVRGVARAGEGAAEFIAPGERIEAKVLRQLRRLLAPGLTDVRVEWGGGVEPAPLRVPPVFSGERLLVYGRAENGTCPRITLRGRGPKGDMELTVEPERVEAGDAPLVIGSLWARAAIRDLEEGRSALHDRRGSLQERTGADRVREAIVRIAKRYSLASRETSFVAIEEREAPAEGQAQLRRVPVALTRGWGGTDQIWFGAGSAMLGAAAPALRSRIPAPAAAAPSGFSVGEAVKRFSLSSLLRPGDAAGELEADSRPADRKRPLDQLVALQRADGSWELSTRLADVLGKPLGDLEAIARREGWTTDEARRTWATALALAWLEARAAEHRDEWSLLAAKARDWLGRQSGGSEEALPSRARAALNA